MKQKKSNQATRKGRGGFTLIELLIVIGLLAALAALVLPKLSADRKKALAGIDDYNEAGTARIEPLQTVAEGSLRGLAKALESVKPTLPTPSELMEASAVAPEVSVQCLPGTSAPVTLVVDQPRTGAVVGYAY